MAAKLKFIPLRESRHICPECRHLYGGGAHEIFVAVILDGCELVPDEEPYRFLNCPHLVVMLHNYGLGWGSWWAYLHHHGKTIRQKEIQWRPWDAENILRDLLEVPDDGGQYTP